jgi:hypothetical protein
MCQSKPVFAVKANINAQKQLFFGDVIMMPPSAKFFFWHTSLGISALLIGEKRGCVLFCAGHFMPIGC